ncbi:hypothetical protein DHL47_05115 [Streptococcus panodentis]|uniref:Phage protein n=1 Tax=Streptococcus panodentis TaxID=1581472 RepID=A0ABS5AVX7_9STRE|nr:hypothetical protein [Streptococcus panodentis]
MLNTILTSLSTAAPTIVSGIAVLILSDLYKGLKKLIRWISQRIQKVFLQRKLQKKELELKELKAALNTCPRSQRKQLNLQKQDLHQQIKKLKCKIRKLSNQLS